MHECPHAERCRCSDKQSCPNGHSPARDFYMRNCASNRVEFDDSYAYRFPRFSLGTPQGCLVWARWFGPLARR
jgi:hypothetical protein